MSNSNRLWILAGLGIAVFLIYLWLVQQTFPRLGPFEVVWLFITLVGSMYAAYRTWWKNDF